MALKAADLPLIRGDPVCPVPEDLPDRSRWAGLKAIGIVISGIQRGGKETGDVLYYILSRYLAANRFTEAAIYIAMINLMSRRLAQKTPI